MHLTMVHQVPALVANLIMMSLQIANNKVSQIEKVWMIVVKMTWKNMNIAYTQI